MTAFLSVVGLQVSYGKVDAVRGASLTMREGQIIAVIGSNGAGKTTLLGALMGLLPSHGAVTYDGVDLRRLDVEQRSAGSALSRTARLFGE
jgi:branched-chain amino acid transport system ATP-binding protein